MRWEQHLERQLSTTVPDPSDTWMIRTIWWLSHSAWWELPLALCVEDKLSPRRRDIKYACTGHFQCKLYPSTLLFPCWNLRNYRAVYDTVHSWSHSISRTCSELPFPTSLLLLDFSCCPRTSREPQRIHAGLPRNAFDEASTNHGQGFRKSGQLLGHVKVCLDGNFHWLQLLKTSQHSRRHLHRGMSMRQPRN